MQQTLEDIEFRLLLEAINQQYGFDFRGYAEASLKRRVKAVLAKTGVPTISQLLTNILHSPEVFASLLPDLTVSTSEMFRDPEFYAAIRDQIIPVLKTFSAFKIWHAGCSTGEEIYSLAILLEEAGLYENAVIYATDINPEALRAAKEGIFPVEMVKNFTANYHAAGGCESFSSYYSTAYGGARFNPRLRRNVVFAVHNLVTDDVFSEVHVILCRNVLIYFDRELQNRVLQLFTRSLRYKGYLCLGSKETVRFLPGAHDYEEIKEGQRIFRKIVRDSSGKELQL